MVGALSESDAGPVALTVDVAGLKEGVGPVRSGGFKTGALVAADGVGVIRGVVLHDPSHNSDPEPKRKNYFSFFKALFFFSRLTALENVPFYRR